MDNAAEFLDAFAEPRQFLLAYLVMLRITSLGVGFFPFLEHRAFAAIVLGPNPIEAPIEPFCQRSPVGDIVVVGSVEGQTQKDAGLKENWKSVVWGNRW